METRRKPFKMAQDINKTARRTVFFVDDDELFLQGLKRSLHHMRQEWEMVFISDPHQALKLQKDRSETLIVSDWMMPTMDGLTLCRKVKEQISQNSLASAYLIVLTGKQNTRDAVEALESGIDDYIHKPFDMDVLVARIGVGFRTLEGERKLRLANEQLEILATTDPLTSLYNRRHGLEILEAEMSRVTRGKQQLSLIMVDLDHFKNINDTYGHKAGDIVLVNIAKRMKSTLRRYDVAIRWGGEEFVVVCPHTDSTEVISAAERLRKDFTSHPIQVDTLQEITVTVSIGTSSTDTSPGSDAGTLLSLADNALYQAKSEGRNCVRSG